MTGNQRLRRRQAVALSVLILVSMVLGLVPSLAPRALAQRGPFADVPPEHWAAGLIRNLALQGVVSGDARGNFRPDVPISRAEWAKLLVVARGLQVGDGCARPFRDVPCDSWFAPPVELAFRVAIMDGRGTDVFAPTALLRRQEAAVSLVRALGEFLAADRQGWREMTAAVAPFPDAAQVADWARPSISWLVRQGLLSGRGGRLEPGAHLTRAEAAALVQRMLAARPQPAQVSLVDGRTVRYSQSLQVVATMYATGEPGVGSITYSGLKVREGIAATDPDVIPLGTLLYVEGYGYAVAADIGGAIKGHRIDLFTRDYDLAATHFGMRPRTVYIVG